MPTRTFLLLSLLPLPSAAEPAERPSAEENILRRAGVPTDADGLLAFFRGRTTTDADRRRVGDLVRRLGADDYADREGALAELRTFGVRAAPQVREALRDPDPEIAGRAQQFFAKFEPPAPLPAVAAARLLVRRAPAGAVPALLDYLPFAGDGAVEDEGRAALAALTPEGKADPALRAALDGPAPVKRAAAAYALARKGGDHGRAAVSKRLGDADDGVRWQAAAGLLAAGDRAAVPCLIGLLADGPFDPAWRAEEALQRLAGDDAPKEVLDDSTKGRDNAATPGRRGGRGRATGLI